MTVRQENKNIYWAWKAMKQRCQNPKCKAYRNYGARGIRVCDEWQQFDPFLSWSLLHGYQQGLDLDRKDNAGNYEPSNCRWIPRRQNINNRRNTIVIEVDGLALPETEWAEKLGVDRALLKYWLYHHGMEYTIFRIKDIMKNGYIPKNFAYGHGKPVRHIESGKTFKSVRDAAKYFGMSSGTLSHYINYHDGKTGKGRFLWEELDNDGNVIGGNMKCEG